MTFNIVVTSVDLLRLIEAVIWPLIIMILIIVFKNELKSLIERIKTFKAPGGIEATIVAQQGEQKPKQQQSQALAQEVETHRNIEKKLLELNERTANDKLVYEIAYHFEKTYRLIFNSQLSILVLLDNDPNQRVHVAVLEAIHRRTPFATVYPFEHWIGFLLNSYLLIDSTEPGNYELTQLGNLFLKYLRDNKISLVKINSL